MEIIIPLPCPYCGSSDVTPFFGKDQPPSRRSYVGCNNCDADGPVADSEEMNLGIILWNENAILINNHPTL